jgi:hypothetical protein
MHPNGILQATPQMFALDWAFEERRKSGPAGDTVQAVRALFERPEFAGLAPELEALENDWEAVVRCLDRLSEGEPRELEPWVQVARAAEELAADDAVAACVVALAAVAAWERALGPNLWLQPWEGHHWGWHVFPLTLARTLLAADAVWFGRTVTDLAMSFIETAKGFPLNEALVTPHEEYARVLAGIDRRFRTCVANLAWDLRAALDPGGPNVRAELAALLWTLGDVPHAERVANEPGYTPLLPLVHDAVDQSINRLPFDSFLQYVWLAMKDRPPLDLRGHKVLFTAINNVYHQTGVHEVENSGIFSPSRTYAQTAIDHFGGSVTGERAAEFDQAFGMYSQLVGMREPLEFVRLGALFNLVLTDDEAIRAERWSELAEVATDIAGRAARRAVFRPLGNCLDIPFYYLHDAVDAVERFRCESLSYWLAITIPSPPETAALAPLREQEEELLRELRGARFIRLLPNLPMHYQRYGFEIGDALDAPLPEGAQELPQEKRRSLLRFDPFDQELAKGEIDDAWQRLESLWEEMRSVAPEYAAHRLEPYASRDEFVSALRASGGLPANIK